MTDDSVKKRHHKQAREMNKLFRKLKISLEVHYRTDMTGKEVYEVSHFDSMKQRRVIVGKELSPAHAFRDFTRNNEKLRLYKPEAIMMLYKLLGEMTVRSQVQNQ